MVDKAAEIVTSREEEGMGMRELKKVQESQINNRMYGENSIPHLGARITAS